jgi:hypothetical protein
VFHSCVALEQQRYQEFRGSKTAVKGIDTGTILSLKRLRRGYYI